MEKKMTAVTRASVAVLLMVVAIVYMYVGQRVQGGTSDAAILFRFSSVLIALFALYQGGVAFFQRKE